MDGMSPHVPMARMPGFQSGIPTAAVRSLAEHVGRVCNIYISDRGMRYALEHSEEGTAFDVN
jgi:hypothetical protein